MIDFKKPMRADEALALLQSDPEWVRQDRERREAHEAYVAYLTANEQPVVADLARVRIEVESVYDLVNTSESYPEAIPVLLKHLPLPYHSRVRQGIGRALTVSEARGEPAVFMLQLLQSEQDPEVRWVLGNAMSVVAGPNELGIIKSLLKDSRYENAHRVLRFAVKDVKRRSVK